MIVVSGGVLVRGRGVREDGGSAAPVVEQPWWEVPQAAPRPASGGGVEQLLTGLLASEAHTRVWSEMCRPVLSEEEIEQRVTARLLREQRLPERAPLLLAAWTAPAADATADHGCPGRRRR
ncbi:hypothetical protein ACIQGZ_15235 [Streptomyces sp. NPDC092296]|uniref:hypothetical protein n=1 Tax=Streptomyces sp. NPDC092296 TaxID=3366012 RepID=UPI003813C493